MKNKISLLACLLCYSSYAAANHYEIDLQYLYWKPHQDGITYAAQGYANDISTVTEGDLFEPDWRYEPGFRAGVSYFLDCSDWNLGLVYTWYKAKASDSVSDQAFSQTLSTWGVDGTISREADAHWRLSYQTLDLRLEKFFWVGSNLALDPFIALRGARITQKYNINYFNGLLSEAQNNTQQFDGIGPYAGLDSRWYLGCDFSLVGSGGFSLLYSRYNVHRVDDGNPVNVTNINMRHRFNTVKPVFEYQLGIGWDTSFCCNAYGLHFLAAWEQQIWFNHNQMLYGSVAFDNFVQNRDASLTLYGLTLSAALSF